MSDQKRPQPPALDRLDHIEQAQALIDGEPDSVHPDTVALASVHTTIAIAQALEGILATLDMFGDHNPSPPAKPDPNPHRPA